MTTVDLYPYLILVGSSILAAAAWLLHRIRVQTQLGQELIRLNEEVSFDLPDFLRKCWPILEAGDFIGLSWRLEWFGATISGEHGAVVEGVLYQHIEVQEISLDIRLFHRKRGWEQRYFSQVLAENFFLVARMDIWIKIGTVRGTFDQTAKMNVFLQHDMKNLLQLVSLASDQLINRQPGQEEKILNSLQKSVPSIRERAKHMLNTLVKSRTSQVKSTITLSEVINHHAVLFEIEVHTHGDAQVSVSEEALHGIFENLLGNYAWRARRDNAQALDLHVTITQHEMKVVIEIEDLNGEPYLWPERLFEPFWSERGASRGIGLYQSRQLATSQGGDLSAIAKTDAPLKFVLTLLSKV